MNDFKGNQFQGTREFRYGYSAATTAGLFMVIIAIALGIFIPQMPFSPPASPSFIIGIRLFGFGSALFFLWIVLQQSTRILTLTETHLIDKNLFHRREIALARVQSIISKTMATQRGSMEATTVQSDTSKIVFVSNLPDYGALVHALHARVGPQGTQNVEQAMARDARSWRLQMLGSLFVIGIFMALGLVYIAQMGMQTAQESQARNLQLDTQGQTVTGRVTGVETRGSKSTTYYLDYTFLVEGQSHSGLSPVSKIDYDSARAGDSIQVTYLPTDPHLCRAAQSISKQRDADRISSGHQLIGFAFVVPFLLMLMGFSNKLRYLPKR